MLIKDEIARKNSVATCLSYLPCLEYETRFTVTLRGQISAILHSALTTTKLTTMTTNTIANDQYTTLFTTECHQTYNITPYPWQVEVGRALIQASVEKKAVKHLCVRPTGGGKSLVFNAVAGAIKGVTLCVCPLLSLGADQSKKVLSKSGNDCTSIASFHLDELSSKAIKALKLWLETPGNLASKSIIIFTSPQAFQNYYYPFLRLIASGKRH